VDTERIELLRQKIAVYRRAAREVGAKHMEALYLRKIVEMEAELVDSKTDLGRVTHSGGSD
jgi:hypothetical protein